MERKGMIMIDALLAMVIVSGITIGTALSIQTICQQRVSHQKEQVKLLEQVQQVKYDWIELSETT
ncbi:hypothetical protein ACJQWY_00800 [Weissella kandleri]|uniref:hypothetical protein n=1 Tax=Weissella kandleri TaxID=1616 RepID=UPI00387E8D34